MAELFPVALQDKFNETAFSYLIGETSVNSQVAVGIPKRRQRYTQSVDSLSGTVNLDLDDWNILETFYKTTLSGGSKTFNYNHPFTQVLTEYRFIQSPTLSPLGGRYFRVTFRWIEIP